MSIGYRPKGESGPAYHPDRDYAYVTPTLMAAAIAGMEAGDLPLEIQNWKTENNITEEEVGAAAMALARAQRDFVNAADPVTSFEQALARRDFLDVRYPVRQFLFASIGRVFCAAWFAAVREVTKVNEESPAAGAMADFIATVHGFFGHKHTPEARDVAIAELQLRNDVLQARAQTLYAEYVKLQEQLKQLQKREPSRASKKSTFFQRLFGG
jgi:chaperonin cofactor prefoldin